MARRIEDTGAETFWPGYVDAVTNLVLNLLFVVVILTMAVFMFALELGRTQPKMSLEPPLTALPEPLMREVPEGRPTPPEKAPEAPAERLREQADELKAREAEVKALQKRIQMLETEARQRPRPLPGVGEGIQQSPQEGQKAAGEGPQATTPSGASGGASDQPAKIVTATALPPSAEKGLERAVPSGTSGGIVIKFADDAIALTRTEMEELRKLLAPVIASGGAKIDVVVPTGFSEARRLAFYRAMAVRNQLIELKVPANRIEISVRDGSNSADSSRVMVSPR